jgi:hypothetical protein
MPTFHVSCVKLVQNPVPPKSMPPVVIVRSADIGIESQRRGAAQRVIAQFGNQIPGLRLLCFFDDKDWKTFKDCFGIANRGFYKPLKSEPLPGWPDYLRKLVFDESPTAAPRQLAFDHVTYLHGSTCANEVSLTMTFAHELQHFVQHSNAVDVWAANTLISQLGTTTMAAVGLRWCDIPHEREARIVSKRTTEQLFGAQLVGEHIDARIAEFLTEGDESDWEYIRELATSTSYDLVQETKLFFPRLRDHRSELEQVLEALRCKDPDFERVDLDSLLSVAG